MDDKQGPSEDISIKASRKNAGAFDKYEFMLKNLQPFRDDLAEKYLFHHNSYHLNMLNNKIKCYETMIGTGEPMRYFECFERVERVLQDNYLKLARESEVLNFKLQNCLSKCSKQSNTNEEFEECANDASKGCFVKHRALVTNLYDTMYGIMLK